MPYSASVSAAFAVELNRFGQGPLHAKRQLVRLDARPHRLVVRILDAGQPIELAKQLELGLLLFAIDRAFRLSIGQRVLRIERQRHAVVLRAEIVGPVPFHAAAAIGQRRAQHDELRQVVVQRAQTVVHPRADRRKIAIDAVPAGVKLKLRTVVAVVGPHRADDGQIVDAVADVRPPIADFDAAFAALAIADLQRQHFGAHEAVVRIERDARARSPETAT